MSISTEARSERALGTSDSDSSYLSRPWSEATRALPFVAGALMVIAFVVALVPMTTTYLRDEAVYLSDAENLLSDTPYYSEAYYRPPLLRVLLWAGSAVMPIELFAHVLVALFFAAGVGTL